MSFWAACYVLQKIATVAMALAHVLRVQFADGIKAANSFLKNRNLEPLRI